MLTPRQQQVVGLAEKGMTRQQIADALGVGVKTVKSHLSGVYARSNARSITDLCSSHARTQEAALVEAYWALDLLRGIDTDPRALEHIERQWRARWPTAQSFVTAMTDAGRRVRGRE